MIKRCQMCEIVLTTKSGTDRIDPSRVDSQICPDCATFDFPNYNKRLSEAKLSMGKPGKK